MTNHLASDLRQISNILGDLDDLAGVQLARGRLERIIERVEQVDTDPVEVDASTELTASFGLEPEQEIRARALDVASYVIGDASGTVNGVAQHLIDLAEPLVGWIRTGQRPQ